MILSNLNGMMFYMSLLSLQKSFQIVDAIKFITPKEKEIYIYIGETATMRWYYDVAANEKLDTIVCGYRDEVPSKNTFLIKKLQQNHAKLMEVKAFPQDYNRRVVPLNGKNFIGMNISQILKTDAKSYYCILNYFSDGKKGLPVYSDDIKLSVPAIPRFVACLGNMPKFIVESKSLKFSCSVFGNPVPDLMCQLSQNDGTVSADSSWVTANITGHVFPSLKRTDKNLVCRAKNRWGWIKRIKRVTVAYGKPSKPQNLRLLKNYFLWFTIGWNAPADDGGVPIHHYRINIKANDGTNYKTFTSAKKLNFTKINIMPNVTYFVRVTAVTRYGEGSPALIKFKSGQLIEREGRVGTTDKMTMIFVPVVLAAVFILSASTGCYIKRERQRSSNRHSRRRDQEETERLLEPNNNVDANTHDRATYTDEHTVDQNSASQSGQMANDMGNNRPMNFQSTCKKKQGKNPWNSELQGSANGEEENMTPASCDRSKKNTHSDRESSQNASSVWCPQSSLASAIQETQAWLSTMGDSTLVVAQPNAVEGNHMESSNGKNYSSNSVNECKRDLFVQPNVVDFPFNHDQQDQFNGDKVILNEGLQGLSHDTAATCHEGQSKQVMVRKDVDAKDQPSQQSDIVTAFNEDQSITSNAIEAFDIQDQSKQVNHTSVVCMIDPLEQLKGNKIISLDDQVEQPNIPNTEHDREQLKMGSVGYVESQPESENGVDISCAEYQTTPLDGYNTTGTTTNSAISNHNQSGELEQPNFTRVYMNVTNAMYTASEQEQRDLSDLVENSEDVEHSDMTLSSLTMGGHEQSSTSDTAIFLNRIQCASIYPSHLDQGCFRNYSNAASDDSNLCAAEDAMGQLEQKTTTDEICLSNHANITDASCDKSNQDRTGFSRNKNESGKGSVTESLRTDDASTSLTGSSQYDVINHPGEVSKPHTIDVASSSDESSHSILVAHGQGTSTQDHPMETDDQRELLRQQNVTRVCFNITNAIDTTADPNYVSGTNSMCTSTEQEEPSSGLEALDHINDDQ